MFFACEDRKQIAHLIVETYNQLSLALILDENPAIAKKLWEKTTAFMIDSVGKSLKVEELVAEDLQFNNKPYHLLCKSHVVEPFDVLATVENQLSFVSFREKLTAKNPTVRLLLRDCQTAVETGICSIVNLISHDKSASSTNQVNLFDYILQRENKVKHIAVYQARQFTKLGFTAASFLDLFKYGAY